MKIHHKHQTSGINFKIKIVNSNLNVTSQRPKSNQIMKLNHKSHHGINIKLIQIISKFTNFNTNTIPAPAIFKINNNQVKH